MNNPCIGCKSIWHADNKTNCQMACDRLEEYKQSNLIEWFAVYCGDEKIDLANKAKPIAYCQYESHAQELIKKYKGLGYYKKLENGLQF